MKRELRLTVHPGSLETLLISVHGTASHVSVWATLHAIVLAVTPALRRKLHDQRDEHRDLSRRVVDKLITWAVQHHTFANVCYKPLFKDLGLKKTRGCAIHNDAVHEAWEAYLARRHDRHYNMDHVRALTVSVHDITDAVVKETKLEGRRRTCRTDSTHVKRAGADTR